MAFAGMIAAAAMFLANPALANSSAAADISAPLRAAQSAKPATMGTGDENFRKLFNNWQSLEETGVPALAAIAEAADQAGISATTRAAVATRILSPVGVSIPSRMPVDGVQLTSSYGMRVHPVLGGRRAHKGVDLAGAVGTPIRATADGVVSMAQWFSSYGLYIAVEHGGQRLGIRFSQFVPALRRYFDVADVAALIAPRPLLIESGIQDNVFPIDSAIRAFERLKIAYDTWEKPERLAHDVFEGGHRFHGPEAYKWFDRWL